MMPFEFPMLAAGALSVAEITILLLSLGVLLLTARLLGELARKFGQPTVLGEILAGVLLGATVLGQISPDTYNFLFPKYLQDEYGQQVHYQMPEADASAITTEVDENQGEEIVINTPTAEKDTKAAPSLVLIAFEGFMVLSVCFLLLVAGLEVDLSIVTKQGKAAGLVSSMSMVVPLGIGFVFAWFASGWLGMGASDNRLAFALFIGVALSITALPVIAKILMDLNMFKSDMGMLIMSSAMVNDLLGWIGFAIVLAMIIPPEDQILDLKLVIPATLIFVGLMLTGGRWLSNKIVPWVQAHLSYPGGILAFVLSMALLCGALTEWIGIHAIFGAFLAGVAIGDSKYLRARTRQTIEQFVTNIFAPIFFAGIALRVDFFGNFDLVSTVSVLVVAIIGKVIGAYLGAKWSGLSKRESWSIGFGMSARGAMEIILAQIALQYNLINQELFVAVVIMAIVTSLMAGPLMQKCLGLKQQRSLGDVVTDKTFAGKIKAATRRTAIAELSELATEVVGTESGNIDEAVWDREQVMSTGIGNAIAVPHARLPGLKKSWVFVGLSPSGVDFDAPDNQLAEIICLILTPLDDQSEQIEILGMVARAFHNDETRRAVLEASNFTQFKAALSVAASEAAEH